MRNIILVSLVLLACLAGCQTTTSTPLLPEDTPTPSPTTIPLAPSLENAILTTIASECWLGESYAIIAHITKDRTVIKVWRYQRGEFEVVDAQLYYDAIGEDRSKWPPGTIEFYIVEQSEDYAKVEVADIYDRGLIPNTNTRGGNFSRLTLQRSDSEWETEWFTYAFAD